MIILSDIHGCYDTFIALLDKIPQEEKDKGIVIAGDLVDRGPKSCCVVQYCIDNNIPVVRGNHEEMMVDEGSKVAESYNKQDYSSCKGIWAVNGGFQTLQSYLDDNMEFDKNKFNEHVEWMKNLPYYMEFKDVKNDKDEYLLVTHSSASRVWHWDSKTRQEKEIHFKMHLVWGRPKQIDAIKGVYNVFGHTPIEMGPKIKSCYANIDTGACYTQEWAKNTGLGVLTALQFPEMIVYQQENID